MCMYAMDTFLCMYDMDTFFFYSPFLKEHQEIVELLIPS